MLAVTQFLLVVPVLRGVRWAYLLFIVLGLASFPVRVDWHFEPRACQITFSPQLAVFSLTNSPHIMLFGLFFMMSAIHLGGRKWTTHPTLSRAAIMTLAFGALVEMAEGVTGSGNCRVRDLIPDSAGILCGTIVLILLDRLLPRPGLPAHNLPTSVTPA